MREEVSLKAFVNSNYHLIAAMGVTAALTALSVRIEKGEYLAAVSFIMFVVLDLELLSQFPSVSESRFSSLRLIAFENLCLNILFFVGFYVLENYTDFLLGLLAVLGIICVSVALSILRFFQYLGKFPIVRKIARYLKDIAVGIFLGLLLAILLATLVQQLGLV